MRVLLVDDHEIVRRGIRSLLEAEPDVEVVGEAESASEALRRVGFDSPDVVVMDVRLPDGSGVEACRDIRSAFPVARLFSALRGGTRSSDPLLEKLSEQERRVLDLITTGLTNRENAEEMFLAEKTVKNYVSNLLTKLGMSRRSEVAAYAARVTAVQPDSDREDWEPA